MAFRQVGFTFKETLLESLVLDFRIGFKGFVFGFLSKLAVSGLGSEDFKIRSEGLVSGFRFSPLLVDFSEHVIDQPPS